MNATFGLFNGEREDLSGSGWIVVLIGLLLIALTGVLALLPVVISRRKASSAAEAVLAGSFLWGTFAAWTGLSTVTEQFKWSKERVTLIQSGYYDPRTKGDGPQAPWTLAVLLGLSYLGLNLLAIARRPGRRRGGIASEVAPPPVGGHGPEDLKPLIHLVDDDPDALLSLSDTLKNAGYPASASTTAADGLSRVAKAHPPIVFAELRMSGMSGLEFLEKIREASPETKVILTAKSGGRAEYETAIRQGAIDLLFKPIGRGTVLGAVGRVLSELRNREPEDRATNS